ncbi:MAG: hypothetical protein JKX75_08300, partial [Gammaproteobacteria bacterium]|nr:hypothetical protein [Gammaproteobacteria bacterium]
IVAALIAFSGPLVYFLHTQFGIEPASLNSALIIKTDAATGTTWTSCEDPISFQWIGPVALLVSITVGLVAAQLFPAQNKKVRNV